MKNENINPAIVIGMGIGGVTAAIYLSRMGIQPLCFEANKIGGKINQIEIVDDYPGFKGTGKEFVDSLKAQLEENEIKVIKKKVTAVFKTENNNFIVTTNKGEYITHAIIIASGVSNIGLPQIDGLSKDDKNLISYKPMDSFKSIENKKIIVWGNNDYSFKTALTLSNYAEKTYLLLSKNISYLSNSNLIEKIKNNGKIEMLNGKILKIVKPIEGDEYTFSIRLFSNSETEIKASKLFPVLSSEYEKANTDFLKNLHEIKDDQGTIAVDLTSKTFIEGVYAVGDVQQKVIKNNSTAVLDGAMAGIMAYHYIVDNFLNEDSK